MIDKLNDLAGRSFETPTKRLANETQKPILTNPEITVSDDTKTNVVLPGRIQEDRGTQTLRQLEREEETQEQLEDSIQE